MTFVVNVVKWGDFTTHLGPSPWNVGGGEKIFPHTNFQLPSSKTVTLLEMGAILPLKTLPLRGGDGVNFSKSISYERHT